MLLGARQFFSKKKLPYDAEVEWLQSDGCQTIGTEITSHQVGQVEFAFSYSKWEQYGNVFYNTYSGEGKRFIRLILSNSDNSKGYFNWKSSVSLQTPTIPKNKRNEVTMNANTITVNGTSYTPPEQDGTDTDGEIILFSHKKEGYLRDIGCRIYSFKMWDMNMNLVRDFIPVRKGGVGYMYDRVSKRLFGNAGTGDFIVGPDIVEVEYLESTGTQYIDTGVILASSNKVICRGSMTSVSSGSSAYFFGAYGNGNNFGINQVADGSVNTGDLYYVWKSASTNFGKITSGELVSLELSLDGVKLNGTTLAVPTGTFTGDGTCYVFWANGTGQGKAIGKIYSLQIYAGTALVRDFIPVRVGMEGAMMDRLTRRIYRNAGTGSFNYA